MSKVILFDIDGTLVFTGGAGRRAMSRAFEDLFRIPDAFCDVPFAGRTDAWIVAETLAAHGLTCDAEVRARFRDVYVAHLAAELDKPSSGKRVMPGVPALLDALAGHPHVHVALLTGNYQQGARLKLEHFDLWRCFACGAFGDEAHDRNGLVPEALACIRASGGPDVGPSDAIVVGDTPLDIACAAAVGARSVTVATGGYDADTLRASGADCVFEDLSDTVAVLSALLIPEGS